MLVMMMMNILVVMVMMMMIDHHDHDHDNDHDDHDGNGDEVFLLSNRHLLAGAHCVVMALKTCKSAIFKTLIVALPTPHTKEACTNGQTCDSDAEGFSMYY